MFVCLFFNRWGKQEIFAIKILSSFNVFNIQSWGNSLKLNKIDIKLFLHNLAFTAKVHFYNWHLDVYRPEMILIVWFLISFNIGQDRLRGFFFYFRIISLCYYICSPSPLNHFGFKKQLFIVPYQYFINVSKIMYVVLHNKPEQFLHYMYSWGSDYQLLRGQKQLNFVLQKEVLVLRC